MGQQLSFSLGLAQIPEIKESELFPEFLRLYNAIKLTASQLDAYTGNAPLIDGETVRPAQINNLLTCTYTCADDIPVARLCSVTDVSGDARASLGAAWGGGVVMLSLEEGTTGNIAKFLLKGAVRFNVGDLTPGAVYRHVGSGYIDKTANISSSYSYQVIGWALDSEYLWFEPDLYWNAYEPP